MGCKIFFVPVHLLMALRPPNYRHWTISQFSPKAFVCYGNSDDDLTISELRFIHMWLVSILHSELESLPKVFLAFPYCG